MLALELGGTWNELCYIDILTTVNGNGSCAILEFVTLISNFVCYVA